MAPTSTSFAVSTEAVAASCARQGLACKHSPDGTQLAIGHQVLGVQTAILCLPWSERGMYMFALALPFAVPAARAEAVALATALLNSQTLMGAWAINTDKGEIYFRITLPTRGAELSDEGLAFLWQVIASTVEQFAPAFYRIASEGAPPSSIVESA